MCTVCGCNDTRTNTGSTQSHSHVPHNHVHEHDAHGHSDHHDHGHHHSHSHDHVSDGHHHYGKNDVGLSVPGRSTIELIEIEKDILSKNDSYAEMNRQRFRDLGALALNLVSSPGAGKTTLLEKTVSFLKGQMPIGVVEGDQETSNDADRIRALGVPAVQVNTGRGCHLDAHMVGHAIDDLDLERDSVVFIENVGNLVCPASFDLGEACKVVILSVTEGDDKPLKYPDMFAAADIMILSKIDLLPYVPFDAAAAVQHARDINPNLTVIEVSALTSAGMDEWFRHIDSLRLTAGKPSALSRSEEMEQTISNA